MFPSYDAAGGEPFWWLEIADGRPTYTIDERAIVIAAPAPRSTRNGSLRVYEAPELSVSIRRQDCEDEGLQLWADTVTVTTAGDGTVHGCGGRLLREAPE